MCYNESVWIYMSEYGADDMDYTLQKAGIWKRAAAWLLDAILVCVLATGVAAGLSALLGYDSYYQSLQEGYDRYEAQYGVTFEMTAQEYEAMTQEQKQNWETAYQALIKDEAVLRDYNMVLSLTLVIISLSVLVAILLLEFALPLILKNGQTAGKKLFGLCLVRTDGVQVNNLQLLVRALLGKCAIETMIPVLVLLMIFWGIGGAFGMTVLALLLIVQLICLCVTRTNAALHDLMAGTAVVDKNSQQIFRSTEDLIAYQKQVAAERAARQTY